MKVTFKNTEHCKGSKEIKREVKNQSENKKNIYQQIKKEKQNNKIKRNYKIVLQKNEKEKKTRETRELSVFWILFSMSQ